MSICPKCGASVSIYDTRGNPWYSCGSTKTFRSASCVDREPIATQLREAQDRIKRLEEALESIREYWSRDNNDRALVDACWYAIDTASEALEAKEAKP